MLIILNGYYWNIRIKVKLLFFKKATFSKKAQEVSYLVIKYVAQKYEKNDVLDENLIIPA